MVIKARSFCSGRVPSGGDLDIFVGFNSVVGACGIGVAVAIKSAGINNRRGAADRDYSDPAQISGVSLKVRISRIISDNSGSALYASRKPWYYLEQKRCCIHSVMAIAMCVSFLD